MGLEKSPGWDGITVEFLQEFWHELAKSAVIIANRALQGGLMESQLAQRNYQAHP